MATSNSNNPSLNRILRSRVLDVLFPRPAAAGPDSMSDSFLRYDEELGRYVYVSVDAGTSVLSAGGDDETSCSICLEPIGERQGVFGRDCDHTFHYNCIMDWMKDGHDHCPNCRRTMWDPTSYAAVEQVAPPPAE